MTEQTIVKSRGGRPTLYGPREDVMLRIPAELRDHLRSEAVRFRYRSMNDFAWAVLDEATGFEGGAPVPATLSWSATSANTSTGRSRMKAQRATEEAPAKSRVGRKPLYGKRVPVMLRIPGDLRDFINDEAKRLGYRSMNDFLWAVLDEATEFDGEAPTPATSIWSTNSPDGGGNRMTA